MMKPTKTGNERSAASVAALALIGLVAAGMVSGCASFQSAKKDAIPAADAQADVRGYLPNTVSGKVGFTEEGAKGLHIQGKVEGLLPDRKYAIHVHEHGDCTTPEASGAHFDPGNSNHHGEPGGSPGAHHAGDLPNLTTDDDGVGHIDFTTNALGIGSSDFSVLGHAIVIHADSDDFETQPSGNSGQKIACGVIRMLAE